MVSGRTDIIAYYTPWFINRLNEGFVDVRNPINPKLVSRIYFSDVDLILFCTKAPKNIIPYLKDIKIPILFNITLTSYNKDIEPNVNKTNIIEDIKEVSKIVGIENTYLRYDPILLNDRYDISYHIKAFNKLNTLLKGYISKYIISFIDDYKNVRNHYKELNLKEITKEDMHTIGVKFAEIAGLFGNTIRVCAEDYDFSSLGFLNSGCVDIKEVYRLTGKLNYKKQNIRKQVNCDCLQTVDIGAYNSCNNLCKYCYANYKEDEILKNLNNHNPKSSLLIGQLEKYDVIKVRRK